ncbi:MAG: restriction endonuclease subunit S [Caldilineaceae bacterium]|nr:restriction endonuclease subunit S [Caldilineaceae bacterium]
MNETWTWRPLGEVTLPTSQWNPRTDVRSSIRYVNVSGIDRDELRIVSISGHSAANAPSRARKIVNQNDTIFATVRPALRRIAQVPEYLNGEIVSTAFCVLRPNPELIHPDFLFFAVQLKCLMDEVAAEQTGASYPAVRDVDVMRLKVPVPPLSDQHGIADTLNISRSAILGQKRVHEATQALKRAAMHTLFTRGLRGEPQKETEIGLMPESWEPATVASVATVKGGKRMPKGIPLTSKNTGQPYVRVTDFSDHRVNTKQILFVPTDYQSAISRYVISSSDVYISIAGTIGLVGQVPKILDGANLTENAARISVTDKKVMDSFLMYALASDTCQAQIAQFTATNAQPKLALARIEQIIFPRPSTSDEQCEVVTILKTIDRKIDHHQRKQTVLKELFQALLYKLMTGKIRVDTLELPILKEN